MKILVTGGAGFIGSHVVDTFINAGHDVVVVDNLTTGRLGNMNPKAKFYQVDIRGPELEKVFVDEKPDVVDHHAAQIDVRRSLADPVYDANINILGSLNVLNLSIKHGVRKFLYVSSGGAVYGEPVYLPCDEKHPIRPGCPYGATKYMMELYLDIYAQTHGLDYSILRYTNSYGPRQDPLGEAGVIAIFIGRMQRGEPITIYGSGEQVRDFMYVADAARANLMLLEQGSRKVYNFASGAGITINQLFHTLRKITGYPQDAVYAPGRAGETFQIYLDTTRAYQELGWQPSVSLEEGLRKTVEYFQVAEL